jgi:DNA-binding SARP family transcriptional activator
MPDGRRQTGPLCWPPTVSDPAHPPRSTAVHLRLSAAPQATVGAAVHALAAHDALLLAWLALEGPTRREKLAELLWPDSPADSARNALRQRLFRLRRQLGAEAVGGSSLLALAPGVVHDLGPSTALLGDLQATESPTLAQWLGQRREALRAVQRPALEARIEALEAQGHYAAALPLALALRQTDPLSEDAHRRVMRLHYLRGDRAAALIAFDECERTLKDEIGTTPSPATLALLRTIEADRPTPVPVQAPASAADPGQAVPGPAPWRGPLPAAVLRPPRLVGRDAELAALRRGWGAGHVLLLTGEAGIGKSRLLQALARGHGGGSPEGVVLASARPGDELVPYASLVRLLQAVLGAVPQVLGGPQADPATATPDTRLPPALRESLAPLLPMLAQTGPDARPRTTARQHQFVAPVQALLRHAAAAAAGPALPPVGNADVPALHALVLDDLHFADEASLELLQALLTAPATAPDTALRWCLGLRPPAAGSRLQALVDALGAATPLLRVPVQPLTVAQVAELVDSLALPGVDGAALAPLLRQRSGGNPLFALETLKLAWAEGGPARLAAAEGALPHPGSLDQLIAQQLARLSPGALTLARVAAIAGPDFSLPLAEKVCGQTALQLADPWHELETQQVLVDTEFAHDLVFEAVLAGVPAIIARHLHGQIAGLLEDGGGEPARVAAHWEAAGQRERALPGLRAAAERAHRALRERERLDFLLRAADIAEATGRREEAFAFVLSAVETHMNAIRQADGFPLLDRLDALAQTPAERAQALGCRAWYSSQLPDHAEAARLGEAALALAQPLGERSLIGPIRQRLATALSMLGRFDEALAHLRDVQPWVEQALAADEQAEFHGNFAVVLDNLGQPEAALPHHRRALAQSQAAADHAQHATQLGNHAVNRLNAGDAEAADALVGQALALVGSFDLQGASVAFLWLLRSQCARALGRWRDALAAADQALALLARSNPARQPLVLLQRAHCWLDLGQHARAHTDLEAASRGSLPPHLRARHLLLLARWQQERGLPAQAALQAAVDAAPPNGWPEVAMTAAMEQAATLPPAEALRRLQAVLELAAPRGLRGTVLRAHLLRAQLCADAGEGAAAADAARQALALGAPAAWPGQVADGTTRRQAPEAGCCPRCAGAPTSGCAPPRACGPATPPSRPWPWPWLDAGRRWLAQALDTQVDASWQDSALHRNPVHAALSARQRLSPRFCAATAEPALLRGNV